jgi:FkbM family methyltransferase
MSTSETILGQLAGGNAGYEAAGTRLADELEHRPEIVEAVINERIRAYSYLAAVRRILSRFRINMIIDAGAHSGQFASSMYGFCGFAGTMHSFEPVVKYYEVLRDNTKYYKGWRAYNEALGDTSRVSTIWVGGGHGGTSSLLPGNRMLARFAPDCVLGPGQPVNVVRLDEKLGDAIDDAKNRVMLKIDTQGYEKKVLLGCGERLRKIRLLHVECCSVPLYEGQESLGELLNFIEGCGFVSIYFSNNFAAEAGVYLDFDVICVNKEEIEAA